MSDETAERAIFSALTELAKADGVFTPEERQWILQVVDEADLDAAEGVPLDREALKRSVTDPGDRRDFLKFALTVCAVDGEISDAETRYLRQLAEDFDVPASEFRAIHESVMKRGAD